MPETEQRLDLFGGYHLKRSKDSPWGIFDPQGRWMHAGTVLTLWSDRIAYSFMAALSAHVETHVAMWKTLAADAKGKMEASDNALSAVAKHAFNHTGDPTAQVLAIVDLLKLAGFDQFGQKTKEGAQ